MTTKQLIAIKSRIWLIRKLWRTRVRRRRKYHRVAVPGDVFDRAKVQPQFVLGMHVLRFASTLRCYQRVYLRIPDDGSLSNTNDRVHVALLLASTLYEAVREFGKIQKDLRRLPSFASLKADVKELNKLVSDASKPPGSTLAVLRNKIMYHFDRETMEDALAVFPSSEKVDVLLGESLRNSDTVYPLIGDSLLSYAVSQDPGPERDIQKYDRLQQTVLDATEKLIHICSSFALDLLKPWIRRDHSPL